MLHLQQTGSDGEGRIRWILTRVDEERPGFPNNDVMKTLWKRASGSDDYRELSHSGNGLLISLPECSTPEQRARFLDHLREAIANGIELY